MGSNCDHASEISIGERVIVNGMVKADCEWFRLGLLFVVNFKNGLFPKLKFAQSCMNQEVPRGGYRAF